ncbi:hypothetical protein EBU58_15555, partial [bacterium]|nr:hypothetical protein [bacterium]
RALDRFAGNERVALIRASIAMQKNDMAASLAALEPLAAGEVGDVDTLLMLAQSYAALRRWDDAERTVARLLTIDPHNAAGLLTRARMELRQGRPEQARETALDAIGLQYGNPQGHFILGMALANLGEWEQAERPLQNCLALNKGFVQASRLLARVYRRLGEAEKASLTETQAWLERDAAVARRAAAEAAIRREAAERSAERDAADRVREAELARLKAEYDAIEPLDLLVVSGLPRSGTSLMMQILQAGGIELLADGERAADEDNPEGYWEWEAIKKLPKDPRLIEQADGKALKVISALLPSLPGPHRYTVIYMVRPVEQVVNSQWAMLARSGQKPRSEKQHLIDVQEAHSRQIRDVLQKSDRVTLLEVS